MKENLTYTLVKKNATSTFDFKMNNTTLYSTKKFKDFVIFVNKSIKRNHYIRTFTEYHKLVFLF